MENNVDKINELINQHNHLADSPCYFLDSNNYPLNIACYFNNLKAVVYLVKYGADIDSVSKLSQSWENSLSNLQICQNYNHKEIYEFLSLHRAMSVNKKYINNNK